MFSKTQTSCGKSTRQIINAIAGTEDLCSNHKHAAQTSDPMF